MRRSGQQTAFFSKETGFSAEKAQDLRPSDLVHERRLEPVKKEIASGESERSGDGEDRRAGGEGERRCRAVSLQSR
jgi:hypothetical protein